MLPILIFYVFWSLTTAAPGADQKPILNTIDKAPKSNICEFPFHTDLVAVTPHLRNKGWAMSPDQECKPGMFCPYACPPGQVMNQWDPEAKTYAFPKSMNGGLFCDPQGIMQSRRPGPLCVDTHKTLYADNKSKKRVAFCQTVLPGNEAMLIPTTVGPCLQQVLSLPDTTYWAKTAAHYYVNHPGISLADACVWGDTSSDKGNWSPYVAGGNMDECGKSFIKIGWNPKHIDNFKGKSPKFGIRVVCDDPAHCVGAPCEINPAKQGYNGVSHIPGCGGVSLGASYCIVTATDRSKARIEVFDV